MKSSILASLNALSNAFLMSIIERLLYRSDLKTRSLSGRFLFSSDHREASLFIVLSRDLLFLGWGTIITLRFMSKSFHLSPNCSDFRRPVCKAKINADVWPGQRSVIAFLRRTSSSGLG